MKYEKLMEKDICTKCNLVQNYKRGKKLIFFTRVLAQPGSEMQDSTGNEPLLVGLPMVTAVNIRASYKYRVNSKFWSKNYTTGLYYGNNNSRKPEAKRFIVWKQSEKKYENYVTKRVETAN